MGQEQCLVCNGAGSIPCPECGGKGKVGGILGLGAKACYGCDGEGRLPCSECQGSGNDTSSDAGVAAPLDGGDAPPSGEVSLDVVDETGGEPEEPEDLQQKLLERVGRPIVDMEALEAMIQERESQMPPPPTINEGAAAPEPAPIAPSPPRATPPPLSAKAPKGPPSPRKGPRGKGSVRTRSKSKDPDGEAPGPAVGAPVKSAAKAPSKGSAKALAPSGKLGPKKKGSEKGPPRRPVARKPSRAKKEEQQESNLDDLDEATLDMPARPGGDEGADSDKTIDMAAPPGAFDEESKDAEAPTRKKRASKASVPPPSELGFGTSRAPSGKRTAPPRKAPTKGPTKKAKKGKKGPREIFDAPTVEEAVPPALRDDASRPESTPAPELFSDEDTQVDVLDRPKAPAALPAVDPEDPMHLLRVALEAAGRNPRDSKGLVSAHSSGVTARGIVALALARRVYEELVSAGRQEHQDALAHMCSREAAERLAHGDGPGAATLVDRAIVIWEGFREAGKEGHEASLARAYVTKAQSVQSVDVTSRVALYDRAMQLHEALADRDAPGSKVDLARTLMAKGVALGYLGDPGSASGAFDRAATLWLQLVQSGEGEYDDDLARAYMNKGVALEQLGDIDKAADLYSLAIRLWRPLVDSRRYPDLAGDLAWTLAYSAAALQTLSQIEHAKQDAREAIAMLESEVGRTDRTDLRDVLAWARSELETLL